MKTFGLVPTFCLPPRLSSICARLIVRLLVYEDPDDCNFYKWDPVRIWEFEIHQPKKKKGKRNSKAECIESFNMSIDNSIYGHPPPPWKALRKYRNWWCKDSLETLGHLVSSPIRQHIINAVEKQSWFSQSPEEDILFLLLRLCMDTQMHFSSKTILPIKCEWFQDLALILDKLGPFPLLKLTVGDDVFHGNPLILSTIIQKSPNLQVLRIGQWELHNDILFSLGGHCPHLLEFCIIGMEPDIFMSDDAFFKCFFSGMSRNKVFECHKNKTRPQLSFKSLQYIDLLFCKQTEKLIQMLSYYYLNVCISAVDACLDDYVLADPFLQVGAKMPYFRISTSTKGLLDERLHPVMKHSSCLKELRLHVDDNFPGADCDSYYNSQIDIASTNLKEFFKQVQTLDSLVLRPHDGVDYVKVTLPTFIAHGNFLKNLYLIYDFSSVSTNTIYQLINLCPLLERLTLDISPKAEDCASKAFITELAEHPILETVVFQDIIGDVDEAQVCEDDPVFIKIAKELLLKSPNLKNFGLHLEDNCDGFSHLHSESVERLHVCLTGEYSCQVISRMLPNFPNLKSLSLDGDHSILWEEKLNFLSKRAINVTKKKPEFANVPLWEKRNFSSSQPLVIMVM